MVLRTPGRCAGSPCGKPLITPALLSGTALAMRRWVGRPSRFFNYLTVALRNIVRHKLCQLHQYRRAGGGTGVRDLRAAVRARRAFLRPLDPRHRQSLSRQRCPTVGPPPLYLATLPFRAAAMRDSIPDVTAMTHQLYTTMTLLTGNRQFQEHVAGRSEFLPADPAARWCRRGLLHRPETVVISQSAARKCFRLTPSSA